MQLDIRNDQARRTFVARVDGHEATLRYAPVDHRTLEYTSTEVPPALRGRGVGQAIVRHALDHAQRHGYQIIPPCPFVRRFVERNPAYAALVAGAAGGGAEASSRA